MEALASIPAIIKIAVVFVLILALGKTRLPFGASLFVAALCIGLWFGMGAMKAGVVALRSAFSIDSFWLVLMMGLIMFFSGLLEKAGQLRQIVDSFSQVVKSTRVKLITMPALIGLLPMPGGALFSAPMVEAAIPGACVSPERKTNINYFFRHIWEFWWPLYPGMIVFLTLTGMELLKVAAINIPLSAAMVSIGYIFFLRGRSFPGTSMESAGKQDFWKKILPLALVFLTLFAYMGVSSLLRNTFGIVLPLKTYMPVYVGLIVGIAYVLSKHSYSGCDLFGLVFSKKNLDLWAMVMGIVAFKAIMEQSGAVAGLRMDLTRYHLPVLGVIFALPFLSGLIFGVMFGTIGASFPLIIPLVQGGVAEPGMIYIASYLAGFIGMMLSPIHACLLLTQKHFGASLSVVFRNLLAPFAVFGAVAAGYYLLLARLGIG